MLGHANIYQPMDTYSHVLPDMQGQAVSAVDSALFRRVGIRKGRRDLPALLLAVIFPCKTGFLGGARTP
jgi:hypothetical protein